MKQIKFRGIDIETGDTVYGYPVIYDSGKYSHWFYRPNEESNCPVKPESIVQLVAVIDGAEIYEGDIVEHKDYYDAAGFLQEHTLSLELCVHLVDEAGGVYGIDKEKIQCVL